MLFRTVCFSCEDALAGMEKVANQLLSQENMEVLNYLPEVNIGSFKLRRVSTVNNELCTKTIFSNAY